MHPKVIQKIQGAMGAEIAGIPGRKVFISTTSKVIQAAIITSRTGCSI
ncbi:MAG TPA: hypothetical protein PLV96_02820 [Methanoregulaceae archaeon]|nr:hypothetical protein [Methanoregulaceae archaeon]HQA79712.1 hypothetical protein [Methanoregulaceae archaeon]